VHVQGRKKETEVRLRKSFVLAAAFATLVLVIGVSGAAAWRKGTQLMHQVATLHSTHKQAADALQRIRENVFLVSILVRDYLLDPVNANRQNYTDQFKEIQAETDRAFMVLEASGLDKSQREAVERLRKELVLHWDPTEIALDLTPEQKALLRSQLLRQRVKSREEIFELAAQAKQLLDVNLTREQTRIRDAEHDFTLFLGWSTLAALVLALSIA
jgi:hypothetical protein